MGNVLLFCGILILSNILTANSYHSRTRRSLEGKINNQLGKKYWQAKAQETLLKHLTNKINTNVAKNIILFLGDGMSIPTLTATRAYLRQINGLLPEDEVPLHFEEFPYTGLSKTYCVDSQVADSACSATAYLGGVKANEGTLGLTAAVGRQDCLGSLNTSHHVHSLAYWAQKAGKGSGIVTTTTVTHASPGGVYAHIAERSWEDDAIVFKDGKDPNICPDLAKQLVFGETGSNLNVIMGGGRKHFYPSSGKKNKGNRRDNVNLVQQWKRQKEAINASVAYVTNRNQLNRLHPVDFVMGLFNDEHINYHLNALEEEPTLEEMTVAAITQLQKFENGFFLFVEGGRIDHGHHENLAHIALDETSEFVKAIIAADALTNPEDTLIVVTSDHAHVMTMSGYARRGNNIFGNAGEDLNGKPYSTLSYANGPGYVDYEKSDLRDLNIDKESKSFKFPTMVPLLYETHGGDDVAVFARGPWSHLFTGSYEQNYIPHAMKFASCLGKGLHACTESYTVQ